MKNLFLKAPVSVRAAAIAIAAYPIAISIYSFRLYAHPKNPDAWFILGVLEAAYLLPAFAILSGSRLGRWFCVAWVAVNVAFGALKIGGFSSQPALQVFLVACWIVQIAVISLLFFPSAMRHFEKKKPNQTPEPTSGIVTPRAEPRVAPIPPVAHL